MAEKRHPTTKPYILAGPCSYYTNDTPTGARTRLNDFPSRSRTSKPRISWLETKLDHLGEKPVC